MSRRRRTVAAALLAAVVAAAPLALRLGRSWPARVAVEGHSMEPTLRAGEWLLVDRAGSRRRPPAAADLVVAHDPADARRWLVKRVAEVLPDGRLALIGDHPAHGVPSGVRTVNAADVIGRPWLRYRPLARFGRVR